MDAPLARPAFNLVVRALILREAQLLVSRWQGGYCFPVGGRIEPGETLEEAILREVREETGVPACVKHLAYFHESFFVEPGGNPIHELGWYFRVEPERPIGRLGERWAHPDSPRLLLEYVPLSHLHDVGLMPPFLERLLPEDAAEGFAQCPRHILSRERPGEMPQHFVVSDGPARRG